MNNKSKAIVSAVAGAALLAGTAGTFALWSASDTIGIAAVQTGYLTIEAEDAVLTDISPDANSTTWSVTDLMVPGDVIQADVSGYDVDASGKNLEYIVTFNGELIEQAAPFILVNANAEEGIITFTFPLTNAGVNWGPANQDTDAFSLDGVEIVVTQTRQGHPDYVAD
jgi:alternate signal-mediated exported protein